MSSISPRPFKNWGDWLIWRSTGAMGDFRMPTCISIVKTEGYSTGWASYMADSDIQRVLARYKEHVIFWNIGMDAVQRELREFADALGQAYASIVNLYNHAPSKRYPSEYESGPQSRR